MSGDFSKYVAKRLREYDAENIVFTRHALDQMGFRSITAKQVEQNLLNPEKLVSAEKQESEFAVEENFVVVFELSNKLKHKYIIVLNRKIRVVTVIKVLKKLQKKVDAYALPLELRR